MLSFSSAMLVLAGVSGSVVMKLDPLPMMEFDVMSPPIAVESCLQMARPRPVPPYFLVVEASACWKGLKSCSRMSSENPIPVSDTVNCRMSSLGMVTLMVMAPCSVNFSPLDTRLRSICLSLPESPWMCLGMSGSME